MRGNKNKGKLIYGMIAAASVVLWLFIPFQPLRGNGEEIYVGGIPDSWPFEYYDSQTGTYQGVLPEMIIGAAGQAGLEIRYVEGSREDNRLELAENRQVDAVWTLGLTDEELEAAGLRKGEAAISFQDGEKETSICLAYTKSMSAPAKEALEDVLQKVGGERTQGLLVRYAREAYQDKGSPAAVWISILLLLVSVAILVLYLIKKRRQVVRLAFQDELTGGDNFASWKRKFEECITDGNREHYAILYLDAGLDTVSHIYGYPESEKVLQIIRDICGPMLEDGAEAMTRFNEFYYVFFLQYTSVESIKKRVRDIYAGIKEAVKNQQKRYFLEPHTGIYRMSGLETEPLKTIQRAEIAAEFSRNHYMEFAVYDEMVEKETVTGYAMEHEAIHGLMHREFIMYLQPVVEMGTGRIMGAEALVRWQNPGRGLLQPGDFLDVIKKKQLTGKMNMDIFRQGCRFLKEEADKGRRLELLFNFTVENVGDEQFPQELDEAASRYGIDRDQIMVQLNQLVEISRSGVFMETIKKLRRFGFHICLAGLELDRVFFDYLECGVDCIKLRHDLIRHINKPEGRKVIQSVIDFCGELGLKVIGMGVENKEQADYLERAGCSYATGFYYFYPVSQDAFDGLGDAVPGYAVSGRPGDTMPQSAETEDWEPMEPVQMEPVQDPEDVVKCVTENVICTREANMENGDTAFQETQAGIDEVSNLMYEMESAKRQIAALQEMLSGKSGEVAALQALLIEKEVLLKRAAVCIREAMALCRQQASHTEDAHRLLRSYEEDWMTMERRMRKLQEEMPALPVTAVIPGGESGVDKARSRLESTVREAEERLKRLFDE